VRRRLFAWRIVARELRPQTEVPASTATRIRGQNDAHPCFFIGVGRSAADWLRRCGISCIRAGQERGGGERQAISCGRWLQGRSDHDEWLSRLAGRCVRSLSRGESARPGRPVSDRELQGAQQGGFRQDRYRRPSRKRDAELQDQPDGHGEHRWPVCVPQGAIERRYHADQGGGAEVMAPRSRWRGRPACVFIRKP
jgi:hypothetical protein